MIGLHSSSQVESWRFIFCHDTDDSRAIRTAKRALEEKRRIKLSFFVVFCLQCGYCTTLVIIILASALPALLLDPGAASLINWQTLKYSLGVFQTRISHLEE